MSTVNDLLKRDLKKDPILVINKRLNKYRDSDIPEVKRAKVDNLLSNTNIIKVIDEIRNSETTKL
jgi:hypothetical protein